MSEEKKTFRVKPGHKITHRGLIYAGGATVELTLDEALIHGHRIEVVKILSIGEQGLALPDLDD